MKRREMIKTASVMATAPLIFPGSISEFQIYPDIKSGLKTITRFGDERDWFFEKRYGMFVHWGLYSIPGWHEQHQWRARVPRSEYVKLANKTKVDKG